MGPIDRFSPVPAYRQIADVLRARISAGEVTPGERLPSERELCETYDVDRGVVPRRAAQTRSGARSKSATGTTFQR
jgi:GntR family transcriptional regulator